MLPPSLPYTERGFKWPMGGRRFSVDSQETCKPEWIPVPHRSQPLPSAVRSSGPAAAVLLGSTIGKSSPGPPELLAAGGAQGQHRLGEKAPSPHSECLPTAGCWVSPRLPPLWATWSSSTQGSALSPYLTLGHRGSFMGTKAVQVSGEDTEA